MLVHALKELNTYIVDASTYIFRKIKIVYHACNKDQLDDEVQNIYR